MRRARASSAPRKTPGKASTLLIWLGKSLRPVATMAAWRRATSGCTSGSGLDSAKTIDSAAMSESSFLGEGAAGEADEHVGAHQRFGERRR